MSAAIPEGFRPFRFNFGFLEAVGPLYGKWDGTRLLMGFRVEERHCNPGQVVHGGMMATFADMFIPDRRAHAEQSRCRLRADGQSDARFSRPAKLGAWVEGTAEFLRAGKTLFFAQGTATADGILCLRASAIFKVTEPMGTIPTPETMFGDG